jgi:hypothetical protein
MTSHLSSPLTNYSLCYVRAPWAIFSKGMEIISVAYDVDFEEKFISLPDFVKVVRSLGGNVYINTADFSQEELEELDDIIIGTEECSLISTV